MDQQPSTQRSFGQNRFQPLLKLRERSDPVINDRWPTRRKDTPASPDARSIRHKREPLTNKEEIYEDRPNTLEQCNTRVIKKLEGGLVRSNLNRLSLSDGQEPHALRLGEPSKGNGSRCSSSGGQDEIHGYKYSVYLRPETRPITQAQLVNEVKGIYSGLAMVEKKYVEIDQQQCRTINKLSDEQWRALIALDRSFLYEHHGFLLASHHPSAWPELRRLPTRYAMLARMWRHSIHNFLELLRHRLAESPEHMLSFVYLAYSMMGLWIETEPSTMASRVEQIEDLARYLTSIKKFYRPDQERWSALAQIRCRKAKKVTKTEQDFCYHRCQAGMFVREISVIENEEEQETLQQLFVKSDTSIARHDALNDSEYLLLNKLGQVGLLCWKQSYGLGRSRTWRFRLHKKKTMKRCKLSHQMDHSTSQCSWGPFSKLPISIIKKQAGRLLHRWRGKRPFNDIDRDLTNLIYFGDHVFSDIFSKGLGIDPLAKSSWLPQMERFHFDATTLPFASTTKSLLPYENFIGAFLTPCYRALRLIESDQHGDIYTAEHLERPQETFYIKVYDMKRLSQDDYKYRMRNLKRWEKIQGHFETIYQRGRKLVVYRSEERSWAIKAMTESFIDTVMDDELNFPRMVSSSATISASVKSGSILFSKIHLHQNCEVILLMANGKASKLKTPAQAKRKQMRQQRYRQNRNQVGNRLVPGS